jgi:hypothetical protein
MPRPIGFEPVTYWWALSKGGAEALAREAEDRFEDAQATALAIAAATVAATPSKSGPVLEVRWVVDLTGAVGLRLSRALSERAAA